MKTRRRLGAGAVGVAVLLLAAPIAASSSEPDAARKPEAKVEAAAAPVATTAPAPVEGPTTTAPPPPPPTVLCPVAGPVSFVDSFGDRRTGHRHQGVDMMAAEGTPAVAPVAGFVEHRGNRTGGLSYHLYGADGTYYFGTHLSAYGTVGWVEAGTIIGYVGGTGNARGTMHLHFEIHPGGEGAAAIDPFEFVAFLCPGGAAAG